MLTGGGDEVTAPPTSENATGTTVVDTTPQGTTVPTSIESAPATAAPPAEPLTEIPVEATNCPGTTTTGTVPVVFMEALLTLGEPYGCRFAGRWMFVVWVNSATAVQEGGLFNIDEPLELGTWLPLLQQTPSGCILDRVLDPATAISLSEGLPPGPCPPS